MMIASISILVEMNPFELSGLVYVAHSLVKCVTILCCATYLCHITMENFYS